MDNEKAADLAAKIGRLLLEFKECTPELNGSIESLDDENSEEWNLHLDENSNARVVIDCGHKVLSLTLDDVASMTKAITFFDALPIKQRKLLMDVLDSEETV